MREITKELQKIIVMGITVGVSVIVAAVGITVVIGIVRRFPGIAAIKAVEGEEEFDGAIGQPGAEKGPMAVTMLNAADHIGD